MAGGDGNSPPGRVLFEFTQLGQQMRVAAIDEASGTEIVVICPLQLGPAQMQRLALAKLRHKLGLPPEPPAPPTIRPGKYA
ncbi:serine hydroxymethyltransferase [Devosia sp.]|uniref:DUF6898 family protein n=1 Tax=Devosia sp. TaxID=1871048 RepID=UPI001AC71565|nr:serine hydroxymethyltransferase [Devosia sp.]MBN9308182.1 hypothetical protein [Devosia sp.]